MKKNVVKRDMAPHMMRRRNIIHKKMNVEITLKNDEAFDNSVEDIIEASIEESEPVRRTKKHRKQKEQENNEINDDYNG